MSSKKTTEKSHLLSNPEGYDSNAEIRTPRTPLRETLSINGGDQDVEDRPILTESTKSSRSRGRPKSRSVLSDESENYDIVVDGGQPGTT